MRKFDYRSPRFPVDLSVSVTLQENTCVARCTEISAEGMRVTTAEPLTVDAVGSILVTCENTTLGVPVRVVHCSSGCEGLQFLCKTDEQRDEINNFIKMLIARPKPNRPFLIG